jgi:hypothetical protein
MITAFWEHHYDDRRREGKQDEEEYEDEDFEAEIAAMQAASESGEEWESVIDDKGADG